MKLYKFQYDKDELDVGNDRAENDWKFLKSDFISTEANKKVISKNHSIITGRKGSGKTSLRVHFQKTKTNGILSVVIEPNSLELVSVFERIVDNSNSPFVTEYMAKLWEAAALLGVCVRIYSQWGINDDGFKKYLDFENLKSVVNDNGSISLHAVQVYNGKNSTLPEFIEFVSGLKKHLRQYFIDNPRDVFVHIDSIDESIHAETDTTKRNDLFETFFSGLLAFFRNFVNEDREPLSKNIFLKLFIPVDIYDWVKNRHRDHIQQYVYKIEWRKSDLEEFIRLRLLHNLPHGGKITYDSMYDVDSSRKYLWDCFFPSNIEYNINSSSGRNFSRSTIKSETRWAIIDMTLGRPRDLQLMVREIQAETRRVGNEFPSLTDLYNSFRSYSSSMKQMVLNEYEYIFPQLESILGSFSGNMPVIDRDVIYFIVKQHIDGNDSDRWLAMKKLYQSGVIGTVKDYNTGSNLDNPINWEFYHDEADFSVFTSRKTYVIHRAFWHSLGIDSGNFRRSF